METGEVLYIELEDIKPFIRYTKYINHFREEYKKSLFKLEYVFSILLEIKQENVLLSNKGIILTDECKETLDSWLQRFYYIKNKLKGKHLSIPKKKRLVGEYIIRDSDLNTSFSREVY